MARAELRPRSSMAMIGTAAEAAVAMTPEEKRATGWGQHGTLRWEAGLPIRSQIPSWWHICRHSFSGLNASIRRPVLGQETVNYY